jgi:Ice-binding-like
MMTSLLSRRYKLSAFVLLALPLTTLLAVACTGDDEEDLGNGGSSSGGKTTSGVSGASGMSHGGSAGKSGGGSNSGGAAGSTDGGADGAIGGEGGTARGDGGFGGAADYTGPSVGKAQTFAALSYSAITTSNISTVVGEIGVSAGAVSKITGFDALSYVKYGTDSLAPNSQRTILAQQDVTALVGDIDPRACDKDLTNVVGGLTGDITLHPGVTCMNSFSADVLVNGHVYLDAGGDPNAFFIIRGNLTLTIADAAQVVLQNGAQACGVFWRISKEVTIGKTVKFIGTVVSGTAITLKSGSTLNGRALAQTAGVQLDANSITIPATCTHAQ